MNFLMRKLRVYSLIIVGSLVLLLGFQNIAPSSALGSDSDLVRTRADGLIATWLKEQNPEAVKDQAWRYRCSAYVTYALASFYLGKTENYKNANLYLRDLATHSNFAGNEIPQLGKGVNQVVECSGSMEHLVRIVLQPELAAKLEPETLPLLRQALWNYVFERSKIALLGPENIWTLYSTENHHSIDYGAYYLALLELNKVDPARKLADGHTISEHILAWNNYWKAFIRGRVRSGLHVEVASVTYAKYTMMAYYNLRDFSPDEALRRYADQFITLNLADMALEFFPSTGVRGGAGTRIYKDDSLTKGRTNHIYHLGYVYGWHDLAGAAASPGLLIPLTSSYRPPAIVTKIATSIKPPFNYTSRRIGRGDPMPDPVTQSNSLSFGPHGESSLRRYSFVTPDYIVGSMSWDPRVDFSILSNQNRVVGVVDASDTDARLMITGVGNGDPNSPYAFLGDDQGYSEISSVGYGNTLIVARDPKARKSLGTQIYISYAGNLWHNSTANTLYDSHMPYNGGWIFSSSDRAYYAFRIAAGSYTVHSGPTGKSLHLRDMWAPIIVQMGRKSDYENENQFRQRVMHTTEFSYESGKLTFKDIEGRVYEYWSNSSVPPNMFWPSATTPGQMGGGVLRFDLPGYTFFSPYMKSVYGEDTVTLRYDGETPLVLDFKN